VVTTRNSAGTLRACLESIVAQCYPSVEIVVVDNESTDATLEIARRLTPYVYTYGPERSAQRNAGARIAHGSYLAFIDSDMILAPEVIEQSVRTLEADPAVGGIIIPEKSVGEGFWARCKALERSCYVGDDSIEAARFFPRTILESVGGYDETLTGPEDWDLSQRVQRVGGVRRIGAYITHVEGRLALRETMQTKFYYGRSMGRYIRQQPAGAARQLQLVRPAFVRQWRRLLAQPALTAGMLMMKGCEFAAGGAGLALSSFHTHRRMNPTP
jgi:glycosyltransferase involved in cell wall biosynthesis